MIILNIIIFKDVTERYRIYNINIMAKKINIANISPSTLPFQKCSKEEVEHSIRCRILIVCEGEKTEPAYFKSFHMMKNSGGLVFDITNDGGGINTMNVVNKAIELRDIAEKNKRPYDSVWTVFDRDSFEPAKFDNAINKAASNSIQCAWSNEAFELWYIYHFDNRTTPMSRKDYKDRITACVRDALNDKNFKYKKNDPNMRFILRKCGCDEKRAISWAENQSKQFVETSYHEQNPCTTVYKLVRLLRGEDDTFNKEIREKMEVRLVSSK